VHDDSITTGSHAPLRCPFCEVYEHSGRNSGPCPSCSGFFSEGFLKALRHIAKLPGVFPESLVGTATQR
jgi:hypothetical protein